MMSDFEVFRPSKERYEFIVRFPGPPETHYEGGVWLVRVVLPAEYPFKSPSVGFCNKMTHPNVCERSGSICLDVLNSTWTPMYDLVNIFSALLPQLLRYPNPSDPLNSVAAQLMTQQPAQYSRRIKQTIASFANDAFVERLFAAIKCGDDAAIAEASRTPLLCPAEPPSSSGAASAADGAAPSSFVLSRAAVAAGPAAGAAGARSASAGQGAAELLPGAPAGSLPGSGRSASTVLQAGARLSGACEAPGAVAWDQLSEWHGFDDGGDIDDAGFDDDASVMSDL